MKKGFTLIELLAVIIILAIIALIATPIVLDIVDDAKKSVANTEARMIVDGVEKYCTSADMRQQLNGTANPCAIPEGETTVTFANDTIKTMVNNLSETKTASVTFNGTKVTAATVESNGFTVTYDGSEFTIAD